MSRLKNIDYKSAARNGGIILAVLTSFVTAYLNEIAQSKKDHELLTQLRADMSANVQRLEQTDKSIDRVASEVDALKKSVWEFIFRSGQK